MREFAAEVDRQIVGIVGDIRERGLDALPRPTFYADYRQRPLTTFNFTFVLQSALPPATLAGPARAIIREPKVFLFDEPAALPKLPLKSTTEKLELIAIRGRAAFVVARRKKTGWFGFPNNFVEKQLGVTATTRQWSTVKKLIDFADLL